MREGYSGSVGSGNLCIRGDGPKIIRPQRIDTLLQHLGIERRPVEHYTYPLVQSFATTICSRVVAQEGAKNCLLLGQFYPCRDADEWDKVYIQPNVDNGNLIKCDTLDELADAMGVPKATFLATVDRYNTIVASGEDTDHGKAPWRLSALDQPPYYAAKMAGWALATLGGVHVDYNFNAVDKTGQPIPGLYMCGLDVGGFFNGNYPQYYGGLCMGRAVTLAWLAAQSIMGQAYPVPVDSARLADACGAAE